MSNTTATNEPQALSRNDLIDQVIALLNLYTKQPHNQDTRSEAGVLVSDIIELRVKDRSSRSAA